MKNGAINQNHTDMLTSERPSICVFCGSSSAIDTHYVTLATALGATLAQAGFRLVYGGGGIGLMGAVAKSAHAHTGEVLGIIPEFLQTEEVLYKDVPHIVVPDMHSRKSMMYDAADGFVILPGGLGTLEEAVEVISWLRMDLHSKPIVFLAEDAYWQPLLSVIEHTISARFTPDWIRSYLFSAQSPIEAINVISREMGRRDDHQLRRAIPRSGV